MEKEILEKAIESDKFTCDMCGEEFVTVSELEDHKRRHDHIRLSSEDEQREFRGDIGAAGLPTSPIS